MKKEKYGVIYLIKNKINNKIYIGQTTRSFDERYFGDLSKTHNEHLRNSINKYGIDNFYIDKEFDVAYSKEELDKLEDMYIKIYNSTDNKYGYNKKTGGSSGIPNKETRIKMSLNHADVSGKNNPRYGLEVSKETRDKISIANTGKLSGENNPMYGIRRVGEENPMYGKTHSEEAKEKIREKLKGNKNMYGKTHSKETKEKIGQCRKIEVFCMTTNEKFDSIKDASNFYNIDHASISKCCKHSVKSAGKHPVTKEKMVWVYYDEYINKKGDD